MGSKLMEKFSDRMNDIRGKLKKMQESGNSGQVVLVAGFIVTLIIVSAILVFTTRTGYKEPVEMSVTEEDLFDLELDDNVKNELNKGFRSLYSAISDKHLDGIYHNITDGFIPFGIDVYEVLSNKKDGPATIEDNDNALVMAGKGNASQGSEDKSGSSVETQNPAPEPETTEPATEVKAEPEPVTEAPTEAPTEPVTEVSTEPETEAVSTIPEDAIIEISGDVQEVYQPGVFVYGDFYDEAERGVAAGGNGYSYPATNDEYYWLYQITEAEAGNQDDVGKILVVNVILNRVYSTTFPNSIKDVIFQARGSVYQFQPVKNGRIYSVVPSENTISCVNRALNGEDYSQGALYFACKTSSYSWFNTALTFLFVHGEHYFYR